MSTSLAFRQRRRARQLAGDARAGSWARVEACRRQYTYVVQSWRTLSVMALLALVVTAGIAYLMPSRFGQGLILGGGLVGSFGGLAVVVMLVTGTAQTGMGSTAEQWTASELRPLRKAGCHVVNHLALQVWDIDHVLLGPCGVFAVESKWAGRGWDLDRPTRTLQAAIDQVSDNARDLRLWSPIRRANVTTVRPVLFLWGGTDVRKPPKPMRIGDVDIVYGIRAARVWRSAVAAVPSDGDPIRLDVIDHLWRCIDDHIRGRDASDEIRRPALPSVLHAYWSVLLGAGVGVTAMILCIEGAVHVPWPWPVFVTAAGVAAAAGFVVRRVTALRVAGLAWAVGIIGGGILIGGAELLQRFG